MSDMKNEVLQLYKSLVDANPNFELKGKTVPYTSANGYMFSQLNKDGQLGIRLSKADILEFDRNFGAAPFKSYGSIMREYVLIPASLLSNLVVLANCLQKGFEYVMSLPPK